MNFYLIDFVAQTDQSLITNYLSDNNCEISRVFDNFDTVRVKSETAPPITEIVENVTLDDSAPLSLLETKTFPIDDNDNWWKVAVLSGLSLNDAEATILRGGYGSRVYLMDSGIKDDHPDFVGKDITLLHSFTDDFIDTTGHGTALASVIVGESCGITEASLKVVKVFDKNVPTMLSDIVAALDAVASDYLSEDEALAVLNISWAIEKNSFVETKIQSMIDMGIFVVAAAGNDGRPVGDVTPASMPDVLTVGSFGKNLQPSDFSNYTRSQSDTSFTEGETNFGALDCFAPGEFIRVAKTDGTYGVTFGTSVAAAITSAILALRIKSSGFDWTIGDDASAYDFMGSYTVKNILDLSEKYTDSPNIIPSYDLTSMTERHRGTRLVSLVSEESVAKWILDGQIYPEVELVNAPEWVTYKSSRLYITAPLVSDGVMVYNLEIRATNAVGTVDTIPFILVVGRQEDKKSYYQENEEVLFSMYGFDAECDDICMSTTGQAHCCRCCESGTGPKGEIIKDCTQCSNFDCERIECF